MHVYLLCHAAQPNLAWAPTKQAEGAAPSKGTSVQLTGFASRAIPTLKSIVMPTKTADVFIAPSANVMGDVKIGAKSSIWYGAVLRGDVNSIEVGSNTNIQDNVVVHVAKHSISGEVRSTSIGSNVTIGERSVRHACACALALSWLPVTHHQHDSQMPPDLR